jgi:hypothetical protein
VSATISKAFRRGLRRSSVSRRIANLSS